MIADAVRIGDLPPGPEIQVFEGGTDVPDGTGQVAFGTTPAGTPVSETFTVRNLGTQALTLGPIAVPAGFSLVSDLGSMTLASGGSTSFTVRFDASTVGGFSGSVSFADNDADEGPYSFTVSAAATAGDVARFAVIGDYGAGGPSEADVAALVKSWNPDFVITVGDNNYDEGEASTIDTNIGQYYHDFIFPYQGTYGAGATVNRFFPSLGNHDWETTVGGLPQPYLDYFTLPGNERYYEFTWGPVHFMAIDSDGGEPDGSAARRRSALAQESARPPPPHPGRSCTCTTRPTRRRTTVRRPNFSGRTRNGVPTWCWPATTMSTSALNRTACRISWMAWGEASIGPF